MALTENDVTRIARLARLELASDIQERVLKDLNGIFGLIEQLQAVDTQGVEPLTHPISAIEDVALRLREDEVTEPATEASRDALLANAPAVQDGLFLVPKVIE
ncbi:Asp-tRNA(Asn)/Glu-tRNA(Gln) amidotransferase subunit GatC [Pigmentiphaga sp.]|jgi:aspartyl/glutamyl-tRNA(Asn/Gln) amidotransferase, C subunit|uniref:Asp-tRNA(Asn)/Glu-tRNA(Gln) amidotransferase subunit GatC n=1 Tax=Pigmentiphaga sp. TaxID=1977564 RepID=UPI0025D1CD5C|nr:Asp-tRNA(Asn)/Glu-tRNA(Gln) amidotransferase subunit GatC [Pigmentiphaga sp.]MBX6319051.1 Asp-tRNA(Asn)/Glu-tRNA(Gln) amidotransferase subunit GatC [Pigmentiphaga sp.]